MSDDTSAIHDLVASIPANPVDLWQVTVWQASERRGVVETLTFVYRVNVSYEEVFPGHGRGAPIVDQWLIYDSEDHCRGRNDYWSSLAPWIIENAEEGSLLNRYFANAESARSHLKKALLSRVERLQGEIEEVTTKIRSLGDA